MITFSFHPWRTSWTTVYIIFSHNVKNHSKSNWHISYTGCSSASWTLRCKQCSVANFTFAHCASRGFKCDADGFWLVHVKLKVECKKHEKLIIEEKQRFVSIFDAITHFDAMGKILWWHQVRGGPTKIHGTKSEITLSWCTALWHRKEFGATAICFREYSSWFNI